MSFLFRLLYAAHASGSHHKLALRALVRMEAGDADAWRRLFLSRARLLLEGSKEPDKSFKDFQNHVLHPSAEGGAEFGGAPEAAERWYGRMVDMLEQRRWDDAVHAAGVLSHYVSDPLMPLHTGSSDAETKVHRGIEWTISKDFEALWSAADPTTPLAADRAEEDGWLAKLIREAAADAHESYTALIEAYDPARGAATPEDGLNAAGRAIASRQLARAATAIAFTFDRAIIDAGMTPPEVSLTARTVVATLGIPVAWVAKKMENVAERAAVRRIYAEVEKTGGLERNMPRECRVVRKAIAAAAEQRAQTKPTALEGRATRRRRLTRDAPLEQAPSIGPKTAARLEALGLKTVGDLLAIDPKSVADGLRDRRITAKVVSAWRAQAGLLVRMQRLRRAEAVLLVFAGYRDVAAIAEADPEQLQTKLAAAAERPEMQRALRSASAPTLADLRKTVAEARELVTAA
ncbi:MAG: DUF4332 domain-containing protein [Neomegalonema sp.]|nr:DUF4332 domain-containing protein [Neomegalonema sp.]